MKNLPLYCFLSALVAVGNSLIRAWRYEWWGFLGFGISGVLEVMFNAYGIVISLRI